MSRGDFLIVSISDLKIHVQRVDPTVRFGGKMGFDLPIIIFNAEKDLARRKELVVPHNCIFGIFKLWKRSLETVNRAFHRILYSVIIQALDTCRPRLPNKAEEATCFRGPRHDIV